MRRMLPTATSARKKKMVIRSVTEGIEFKWHGINIKVTNSDWTMAHKWQRVHITHTCSHWVVRCNNCWVHRSWCHNKQQTSAEPRAVSINAEFRNRCAYPSLSSFFLSTVDGTGLYGEYGDKLKAQKVYNKCCSTNCSSALVCARAGNKSATGFFYLGPNEASIWRETIRPARCAINRENLLFTFTAMDERQENEKVTAIPVWIHSICVYVCVYNHKKCIWRHL